MLPDALKEALSRYEDELVKSIVPFWERNCVDTEDGGFYSFLDRQGKVYDMDKFIWGQWRAVYMFATLYQSEYSKPEWLAIAQQGFDFLMENGRSPDGRYCFALDKRGAPVTMECPPFSIYSESFAAIGAAALHQASGDKRCRYEAIASYNAYKRNIELLHGKDNELKGRKPRRPFGHRMILANAAFVLGECLGSSEFDADIDAAAENVFAFWHDGLGMMFENLNPDGTFDLESSDGRLLNPGHALEAMWFILQYAEKKRLSRLIAKTCALVSRILDYGWDEEFGGIFYFKDAMGRPLPEPRSCLKVWWSQNEAAIAALYAYKLSGDKLFLKRFQDIDRWAWKNFRDPEYGEWFGYVDRKGDVCHTFKANGWKTFFHIPRCLLKCIELMKSLDHTGEH